MYCIALKISVKSPSAISFSAVPNTDPDAAHALFLQAHQRLLLQDDIHAQHLFCLKKQQNYFHYFFCASDASKLFTTHIKDTLASL